jgi:hypothetical protein
MIIEPRRQFETDDLCGVLLGNQIVGIIVIGSFARPLMRAADVLELAVVHV